MGKDGKHHELNILESCYRKSLQKAAELKCESIAFPLISTGVYGFPKDKALHIAVSVFSEFLMENDMQVILVVFDKKSIQLSGQLVGEIDSYIDANYVMDRNREKYSVRTRGIDRREMSEEILYEEMSRMRKADDGYSFDKERDTEPSELRMLSADISLEDKLANIGVSFHDKLFELIDAAHFDNKDVWKRANLDRKHFSKIQCDVNYHPKKKTVMALCIALELDWEQSKDLMARAGKVKIKDDPRFITAPFRETEAFQKLYNQRTSVERTFGDLKDNYNLDNIRGAKMARAKVFMDLSCIALIASRLSDAANENKSKAA